MYAPLTDLEKAEMTSTNTPQHERQRLYGRKLLATSEAYATAADAVGLRKDAARYLLAESLRLHTEGLLALDWADQMEEAEARHEVQRIRHEQRRHGHEGCQWGECVHPSYDPEAGTWRFVA